MEMLLIWCFPQCIFLFGLGHIYLHPTKRKSGKWEQLHMKWPLIMVLVLYTVQSSPATVQPLEWWHCCLAVSFACVQLPIRCCQDEVAGGRSDEEELTSVDRKRTRKTRYPLTAACQSSTSLWWQLLRLLFCSLTYPCSFAAIEVVPAAVCRT